MIPLFLAAVALRRRALLGRALSPWLRSLRRCACAAWRALWLRCAPVDIHPAERRPLDILQRVLRQGGAIYHDTDRGEFTLTRHGETIGCGASLAELALHLDIAEGKLPSKTWCYLRMSRGILNGYARVMNTGESMSAFLRLAAQREIARRQEEDRLALCGGFFDGADYLADLDEAGVQHARAA